MPDRAYIASLSQTQGRSGYSIIFRHPIRKDEATGKVGLRIRRGLNTRDRVEAERLQDQLNDLLREPRFHDPAAKAEAERRFDPRVIDIFYDKMVPEEVDVVGLRDARIPLPESEPTGYRKVLLLGTTGAGKTTLVRQLIGTDPVTERFPSTSTAKTTIHDTEIVIAEGPWLAAVTFVSYEEAREYLGECLSAAVLAAAKGADDASVLRRMLNHVNQRFRFSYVLGNGPVSKGHDFDGEDEDDVEDEMPLFAPEDLGAIDLDATNELLAQSVAKLRKLATRLSKGLREDLGAKEAKDERVIEEIFEEELDNLLRDEEGFHEIVDDLMDEMEKRFDLLPPGEVQRTRQGWPRLWAGEWPPERRSEFVKAITRFSSNYARFFGRLLTPLVNGVRVSGPFRPTWNGSASPKLVLMDGEGLGHTPNSSSAVSTSVSRRIDTADAVLLVDSAAQPMQAAPLSAMREVVATGNTRKLILAFTHFDEVKGDNLPNASAKAQHVLASAENVLASFGEELGPYAERALRKRVEAGRVFLGGLQDPLTNEKPAGKRTIQQLEKLLELIDRVVERPQPPQAHPVYDRINLVLAIKKATEAFHESWRPRLGLGSKPGIAKEHWTRVKALSRRLATGMNDEYDTLQPVADLRKELRDRIYVSIQNPLRWEGPDPSDEQRQATYDSLADNVAKRLLDLSRRRVWQERMTGWQAAYDKRGAGSTFVRARIIADDVYVSAAPVPDETPSPDRNQFLHDVVKELDAAAAELGAQIS